VAFRSCVQRLEFLGCQPHGDNLHQLGSTPGAAATSTLQFSKVIAGLGLVGPLKPARAPTRAPPTRHYGADRKRWEVLGTAVNRTPSEAFG
jgi:hypothetical protein